jgi:hypothetical protein
MDFLTDDEATTLYGLLTESVPWTDGVLTRQGKLTRKQCHLESTPDFVQETVVNLLSRVFSHLGLGNQEVSVYLNYYRDGKDWCPKHRHLGTMQVIVSLGHARTLYIDGTPHRLTNGSVIEFGPEYHEMRSERTSGGRISIVGFYV